MSPLAAGRRAMPYQDYLALPAGLRAEWINGEAVVRPPPTYAHQQVSRRLANTLEGAFPDVFVVEGVAVTLPGDRERVPDISVFRHQPPCDGRTGDIPLVVVEVLSAARHEDLVRKSSEYFAAGVRQCWLVEPLEGTIQVYGRTPRGWVDVARLDETGPVASVAVSTAGVVQLDRAVLFMP